MRKVLVTGGTGFLGKHVQHAFDMHNLKGNQHTNELWYPSSKDLDLLDAAASEEAIAYIQPDVILHMAAVCGGILANKNSPCIRTWICPAISFMLLRRSVAKPSTLLVVFVLTLNTVQFLSKKRIYGTDIQRKPMRLTVCPSACS